MVIKSVGNSREPKCLETNLEAAAEIARQLRSRRDLGEPYGDMKLPDENKRKLMEAMEGI